MRMGLGAKSLVPEALAACRKVLYVENALKVASLLGEINIKELF
jgi:hypothetical protein